MKKEQKHKRKIKMKQKEQESILFSGVYISWRILAHSNKTFANMRYTI